MVQEGFWRSPSSRSSPAEVRRNVVAPRSAPFGLGPHQQPRHGGRVNVEESGGVRGRLAAFNNECAA